MLDPAVGGGAFLIEAYLRFVELGVDDAAGRLYGVDLDGVLRDLSATVIAFFSGALMDDESAISNFVKGDSLLTSLDGAMVGQTWQGWFPEVMTSGGFDAVLMNPPYLQLKVNRSSLPARSDDSPEASAFRLLGIEQARAAAQKLSELLRAHPEFRYAHGGVPIFPVSSSNAR